MFTLIQNINFWFGQNTLDHILVNEILPTQTWIKQNFSAFTFKKERDNGLVNLINVLRTFCLSIPEYDKGERRKNNHMFVVLFILSVITKIPEYCDKIMISQETFSIRYPFFNQYDEFLKYKLWKYIIEHL
jgi:hypothetical protein